MREATPPFDLPLHRTAGETGWPLHLKLLGGVWLAILALYWRDAADMVKIWWTSSTYGHCLFLPFLIGWLVWQRRDELAKITPRFWGLGLAWMAIGAFCWALGDASSLGVIRQGALVLMLQGAVAVMFGRAATRGLLFPLFYAFFMVPVGSELEPVLQLLTAYMAVGLLHLFAVPAHLEGIFITIPTGYFKVAEACSGAKFLVAMAAYGVLVCAVCFQSWSRRVLFLVGALVTCMVANGVRAFGTIYVAHLTTTDAAVGFDHVIYGWLFFAFVMLLVMALAWPFFDRRPEDRAIDGAAIEARYGKAGKGLPLIVTVVGTLALILAPPLWSRFSVKRGQAELITPSLPDLAGWKRTVPQMHYPWKPRFDGANYQLQARYQDAHGHQVDLFVIAFGRQEEGRELIGFGQGVADPDSKWVWSAVAPAPANGRGEEITAPGPVVRHVVSFYRVGDAPLTGSKATVKLDMIRAKLLGRDQRTVAILISAEQTDDAPADAAIGAFLQALGDPLVLARHAVER